MRQQEYYIQDEGRITGPVTEHFIHILLHNGIMDPADNIRPVGGNGWSRISDTPVWMNYQEQYIGTAEPIRRIQYPLATAPTDQWFNALIWMPALSMVIWYLVLYWRHFGSGATDFGIRMDMGAFSGFWIVIALNIGSALIDCYRLTAAGKSHNGLWLAATIPPWYFITRAQWTGAKPLQYGAYFLNLMFGLVFWTCNVA